MTLKGQLIDEANHMKQQMEDEEQVDMLALTNTQKQQSLED